MAFSRYIPNTDPFAVVKQFERALAEYTGAPYAVTTTSCTMALLLACSVLEVGEVTIPKRTYVGVAQSILNAGGTVKFTDLTWHGDYWLAPYPIIDSARWLTSGMYQPRTLTCLSFHQTKHLAIGQAGAILLDDEEIAALLRRMRFDGREEGVHPKDDDFLRGWHAFLSPELAAQGLLRLASLPKHNKPLPNSDYADLSQFKVFQ